MQAVITLWKKSKIFWSTCETPLQIISVKTYCCFYEKYTFNLQANIKVHFVVMNWQATIVIYKVISWNKILQWLNYPGLYNNLLDRPQWCGEKTVGSRIMFIIEGQYIYEGSFETMSVYHTLYNYLHSLNAFALKLNKLLPDMMPAVSSLSPSWYSW